MLMPKARTGNGFINRAACTITSHGYHNMADDLILSKIERGRAIELTEQPGNFVIAVEDETNTWLISSLFGIINYYYSVYSSKIWHGAYLLPILKESGQKWKWNWEVLGDVICLQHSVGEGTLHPNVTRLPPATVLHFTDGQLSLETAFHPANVEAMPGGPAHTLAAFTEELGRWLSKASILSASGGLDSRTLLAGMLAAGQRPHLVVTGPPDGTDRQIVEEIARKLDLPVTAVMLNIEDYIEGAEAIVHLTNGTTAAEHWHTYIYPRKAGLNKAEEFFVGTNGEFARTHYANMGLVARTVDLFPERSLNVYWRLREKRPFRADEIKTLAPDFAAQFTKEGMRSRRRRFTERCVGQSILDRFDRFYLRERITNFIGNGIALYNATTTALMPMLSRPWVERVAGLPRRWRLGDNWHRYALAQLYPKLLEFPEEGIAAHTSREAPLLYWRPGRKNKGGIVPYWPSDLFTHPAVLEQLGARADLLQEIVERRTLRGILDDQATRDTRGDAISHLMMLAFWLKQLKAHGL
jgi:asparagine synthase (glutamine-hydrolysing)